MIPSSRGDVGRAGDYDASEKERGRGGYNFAPVLHFIGILRHRSFFSIFFFFLPSVVARLYYTELRNAEIGSDWRTRARRPRAAVDGKIDGAESATHATTRVLYAIYIILNVVISCARA